MIEYKTKKLWKCPYCNKEFDTHEDALECSQECADIEYPIEDNKTFAICGYCGDEFDDESEAEDCEQNHIENKDRFYSKYALKIASQNPNQLKLNGGEFFSSQP